MIRLFITFLICSFFVSGCGEFCRNYEKEECVTDRFGDVVECRTVYMEECEDGYPVIVGYGGYYRLQW